MADSVRTCIGCRRAFTVGDGRLVRIVRTADGSLVVSRTLPGRGAWLCGGTGDCLTLALRRRAIGRALRADVSPAALLALRADTAFRP